MSKKNEDRQAIIRAELHSTESDTSSTNAGPSSSITSSSSSIKSASPSEETPETASAEKNAADLIAGSEEHSCPSSPKSSKSSCVDDSDASNKSENNSARDSSSKYSKTSPSGPLEEGTRSETSFNRKTKTKLVSSDIQENKMGGMDKIFSDTNVKENEAQDPFFSLMEKYTEIVRKVTDEIERSQNVEGTQEQENLALNDSFKSLEGERYKSKHRMKSDEALVSERQVYKDSTQGRESNIASELQKTTESRRSVKVKTKHARLIRSLTKSTDEISLSQKLATSQSQENSRSEEATSDSSLKQSHVACETSVPMQPIRGYTLEEIEQKIEDLQGRILSAAVNLHRHRGVRHYYNEMIVKEDCEDFEMFRKMVESIASLESYLISLNRRCCRYRENYRILGNLLPIVNEKLKSSKNRRLIIKEAFQRALQEEELLKKLESRNEGNTPTESTIDIFQETLGTINIPKITENYFKQFNRALGINPESTVTETRDLSELMQCTSGQPTEAERTLVSECVKACTETIRKFGSSSKSSIREPQVLNAEEKHSCTSSKQTGRTTVWKKHSFRHKQSARKKSEDPILTEQANTVPKTSVVSTGLKSSESPSSRILLIESRETAAGISEPTESSARGRVDITPNVRSPEVIDLDDSSNSSVIFIYAVHGKSLSPDKEASDSTGKPSEEENIQDLKESSSGSRPKGMHERSISESEFKASSPSKPTPTVKRIVQSLTYSSEDSDRSPRKRGHAYPQSSDLHSTQEGSPAKKNPIHYSPTPASSRNVASVYTEKPFTSDIQSYSNESQQSGSMANISESPTESRDSTASTFESTESSACSKAGLKSNARSPEVYALDESSSNSSVIFVCAVPKSSVSDKEESDSAEKSSEEENIEAPEAKSSQTETSKKRKPKKKRKKSKRK